MMTGRSLEELARELQRQAEVKRDYLIDTRNLTFDALDSEQMLTLRDDDRNAKHVFGVNDIANRQIGGTLGIPAKYYDRMRKENPDLLARNVNSWFQKEPSSRMIRTLDGTTRAFLSDRYRRIDNVQIAEAALPVIFEMDGARVESCEITDSRMYLKVVNPRLTTEVVPGDIVQAGILITNSEVGLGSVCVQPLVYRLVCSNGMVVNDASTRKYHIGRGNEAGDDYQLFADETLQAEDRALMLKVRDTVRAAVDAARFEKVVEMMRKATEARITTTDIPNMVEVASADYGLTQGEGKSVLDHLIHNGEFSLYGMANAVTRAAHDANSYDRSTEMESIGYSMLGMSRAQWNRLNGAAA